MTIHFDHQVLVNGLEDVGRVEKDCDCAESGYAKEEVQLQAVDHHRDVFPVLTNLTTQTTQAVSEWKVSGGCG